MTEERKLTTHLHVVPRLRMSGALHLRPLCAHMFETGINLFIFCFLSMTLASVMRVGIAQSVQRHATGWTVRGLNPGVGDILLTCSDRLWGPLSLLYYGYQVFPGGKAAGAWR
jgi:hypothetical protein